MKHLKFILLAVIISAVISAIFTHFSIVSSTYQASSYAKDINFDEVKTVEGVNRAALVEDFKKAQNMSSPYEYPGFFRYWFKAFWLVYSACFISCILTYIVNIKFIKTINSTGR
jgi:hypothetical protein